MPCWRTQVLKQPIKTKTCCLYLKLFLFIFKIERRIRSFMEKKQLEVDDINRREFYSVPVTSKHHHQLNSCARTDAIFIPRAGYKSHVKGKLNHTRFISLFCMVRKGFVHYTYCAAVVDLYFFQKKNLILTTWTENLGVMGSNHTQEAFRSFQCIWHICYKGRTALRLD